MFTQPIKYSPETAGEFKYVTGTVTRINENRATILAISRSILGFFNPRSYG